MRNMMKDNKVCVNRIELKIKDKTISLSVEEAKELSNALKELFDKTTIITTPYIPYVVVERRIIDTPRPFWSTTTTNYTLDAGFGELASGGNTIQYSLA